MNDAAQRRTWLSESLKAPRDATNLVLGLATAFGVLALLRPELPNAPLKWLVQNWAEVSYRFWSYLGYVFEIAIPSPIAVSLTIITLFVAMFIRAAARGYLIESPMFRATDGRPTRGFFGWASASAAVAAVAFLFSFVAMQVAVDNEERDLAYGALPVVRLDTSKSEAQQRADDARRAREAEPRKREYAAFRTVKTLSLAVCSVLSGLILALLFLKAPRAFWGSILATVMLLVIGMIRIPSAAT